MLRVTEALKLAGLIDTEWLTEEGALRGTAAHAATALDDRQDLVEESVHPEVRPLLESWRLFRRQTGLVVLHVELEVEHRAMGYAGRLDRIVQFPERPRPTLLDLKSGASDHWHPAQTAGYSLAYGDMIVAEKLRPLSSDGRSLLLPERGCVYLQADGSPARFVPHRDRFDFDLFRAAVTLAHHLKKVRA